MHSIHHYTYIFLKKQFPIYFKISIVAPNDSVVGLKA